MTARRHRRRAEAPGVRFHGAERLDTRLVDWLIAANTILSAEWLSLDPALDHSRKRPQEEVPRNSQSCPVYQFLYLGEGSFAPAKEIERIHGH